MIASPLGCDKIDRDNINALRIQFEQYQLRILRKKCFENDDMLSYPWLTKPWGQLWYGNN